MKLCYCEIIWWNIEFKIIVLGDGSVNTRMLIDVPIENLWSIFVMNLCADNLWRICEFEGWKLVWIWVILEDLYEENLSGSVIWIFLRIYDEKSWRICGMNLINLWCWKNLREKFERKFVMNLTEFAWFRIFNLKMCENLRDEDDLWYFEFVWTCVMRKICVILNLRGMNVWRIYEWLFELECVISNLCDELDIICEILNLWYSFYKICVFWICNKFMWFWIYVMRMWAEKLWGRNLWNCDKFTILFCMMNLWWKCVWFWICDEFDIWTFVILWVNLISRMKILYFDNESE